MKRIGLGIIGLGYIGMVHLRNSMKLANAHLVAVSDLSKRALNEAKNAGVEKTFVNYRELLKDDEVCSVIIALPTHLHAQCVRDAAEAKKHIFLEKPIARNVAEAKEVISAAQRNSVKLMIGYPLRFNRAMIKLKEQIRSGSLGNVEVAYATFVDSGPFKHRTQDYVPSPVPEWWFKKELTGGGALIDLGSHMINLLRWYFGEITDIKSYLGYRFNMNFEDHAICLTRFESGTLAVINVGWFSQQFQQKVETFGTVKHAIVDVVPPNRILAAMQMLAMGTTAFWRPHVDELQHFVNCIFCDKQPSPTGNDGLRDIEAIESAYNAPQLNPT
jgi:myo-inositol 2-dehydrogenase/D-chiro-inositol 1-dehydrogenase